MRLNPMYKFFISIIYLALMSLVSLAQTNTIQSKPISFKDSNILDLKIKFPDIEGWDKSEITKYPIPELGYSINYESEEGGRVTVYIYNGGKKNIPGNINDKILKGEIDKAKGEIIQVGKMGAYQNVKEIKNDEQVLGGEEGKVKALHSLFSFSARGQQLTSEIFLFGYQNHFIKLRATRPFEKEDVKNQAMIDLLSAIDKLFSNDETLVFDMK